MRTQLRVPTSQECGLQPRQTATPVLALLDQQLMQICVCHCQGACGSSGVSADRSPQQSPRSCHRCCKRKHKLSPGLLCRTLWCLLWRQVRVAPCRGRVTCEYSEHASEAETEAEADSERVSQEHRISLPASLGQVQLTCKGS